MKKEIDLLQFPQVTRKLGRRTERHREIARRFDKEFFDGSRDTGYGGYNYDGRWVPVALRMLLHYGLAAGDRVLDIGCGKGFMVKDMRALGLQAYGIDVSQYAIEQSVCPAYTLCCDARAMSKWAVPHKSYRLAVSINTLHNLEQDEVVEALRVMSAMSDNQYVMFDAYRTDEEKRRMFDWNLTAKTILHVDEWKALFRKIAYIGDYGWFIP